MKNEKKKEKTYLIYQYAELSDWSSGMKFVMVKKYANEKRHTAAEWENLYQAELKRKIN